MTLVVSAKFSGRSADVSLPADATVGDLLTALHAAFSLADGTSLRVLHKGKAIASDNPAAPLSIPSGAKLMVMASKAAELQQLAEAKPERMRGFAEDDQRTRTGSSGGGGASARRPAATGGGASDPYRFHAIQALQTLPPGAAPPVAAAEARLRELQADPAIREVMRRHGYSVGRLSEMPPEGFVGVSESCTMGLNKNRGEEIFLRLRTDDWQGLRPYASLVPVVLHELTHNEHSDHGPAFKALCAQLTREHRQIASERAGGRSVGGGGAVFSRAEEAAAAAVEAGHVLGGGGDIAAGLSAREAAAMAAAARIGGAAEPPLACACGVCAACDVVCDECPEQGEECAVEA